MAIFTDVFEDVTKQGRKIPTSDYHKTGVHPIIDQGQSAIAGYTDETDGLFTDVPAIIFGDHTRVLKYVDTPCFLGADGVKLLKSKIANPNYKYLYYVLSSANIPNTGYNRHFKWLKEVNIPLPNVDEQQKIVDTLDKIGELITLRKEQLTKLDQLVKSRFSELFGEVETNVKGFPMKRTEECCKFIGGAQPDKSHFEYEKTDDNIRLIQIRDYKSDRFITYIPKSLARKTCTASDIMIGRYGPPIFQILGGIEGAYNVALMKAVPSAEFNTEYFRYFLKSEKLLHYLESFSQRTAGQDGIQIDKLNAYPCFVPPMELQILFAAFVEQTDKSKLAIQQSLDKLELLKKSLMQEYFG